MDELRQLSYINAIVCGFIKASKKKSVVQRATIGITSIETPPMSRNTSAESAPERNMSCRNPTELAVFVGVVIFL